MLRAIRRSADRAHGLTRRIRGLPTSHHALRRPARPAVEAVEPRLVLSIQPVVVGSVYVEEDMGNDAHGDTFYLTFEGGAPGTQLTHVEINGDQNELGFNVGDVFFDTSSIRAGSGPGRLGADEAFPFEILSHEGIESVRAIVQDGTTLLRLEFEGFEAGERLVFSIDVDEAEEYDPLETDLDLLNEGIDPITSGVEFQSSTFLAGFSAPHFEDLELRTKFRNLYDPLIEGKGLKLPADDEEGKRDRTAGAVGEDLQVVIPASLSGHVYHDANQNGQFDPGEVGLPGVPIQAIPLETIVDQTIESVVTDQQGYYQFERLMPGRYQIVEPTQPDGYIDWLDSAGTVDDEPVGIAVNPGDLIDDVHLSGGSVGIDYDFGEILPVSLSGSVHLSTEDGDCFSEDIEHRPLAGVQIRLLDSAGQLVTQTTTDADGHYAFFDLMPGTYTVVETTPVGLFDGGAQAGWIDGLRDGVAHVVDANTIGQILLTSGQAANRYDFCEHEPSELSGYVYHDRNDDGRMDVNEEGIGEVIVQLFDATNTMVASSVTDSTGAYAFGELTAGHYRIVELHPVGWLDGKDTAGTIDGLTVGQAINPGDSIEQIVLGWGQTGVEFNFGELQFGSLAGRVHADLNSDCILQENEWPLAGVTIELLNADGQVIKTAQTDDQGEFRFDELRPGEYTVREIQPEGYFSSGQTAGSGGGNATIENVISQIVIEAGQDLINYNYCEEPPSSISGYVFQDGPTISLNFNENLPDDLRPLSDGLFTPNDRPLSGVVIELRHGVFATPIDGSTALPGYYGDGPIVTTTDEHGYYEFTGLRKGNYSLYEIQPEGFHDGIDTSGTVPAIAINRHDIREIDPQVLASLQQDPNFDAIVRIALYPHVDSQFNNFSEVLVDRPIIPITDVPPPAAVPPPATIQFEPLTFVDVDVPMLPYQLTPYGRMGRVTGSTWHLSVLDGGTPRGEGETVPTRGPVWFARTNQYRVAWNDSRADLKHWVIKLTDGTTIERRFGPAEGIPFAGDFDGDGIDEIGVFHEGQWFIDLNGNGVWDEGDLWARLGHLGDQPVVGDWNGDGKDDIGVFGIAWPGDPQAIDREPGVPDRENEATGVAKNHPPNAEETTRARRDIRLRAGERTRSDMIDHVFHFGVTGHHAVSGDWNGDGINNVGVFDDGLWHLDLNGDGAFGKEDMETTFGQEGDIPIVGDFDGDGIDEIGILSHGRLVLDINRNFRIDDSDVVIQVDRRPGRPVVGDWNGDGVDEVAIVYDDMRFVEVDARN